MIVVDLYEKLCMIILIFSCVFGSDVYKMEQEQTVEEQRSRARLIRMASGEAPPKVPLLLLCFFYYY